MIRARRGLRALATAAVVATGAGCTTAADEVEAPAPSRTTTFVPLSETLAGAALPTEDDLQTGWRHTDEGADRRRGVADGMQTEPAECIDTYLAGASAQPPEGSAEPTHVRTRFRRGKGAPPPESMLVTIESHDHAYPEAAFDAAGTAMATCRERYTVSTDDGARLTYELKGINLPNLGDRSFGVSRMTRVAGMQVVTNSIMFSVDNNLVSVEHIGMTSPPDPELTERVARGIAEDLGAAS